MTFIAENKNLKISEGYVKGQKVWGLYLKKARVAIYLGPEEKITLFRTLESLLNHPKQPAEGYYWVGFGYGLFNFLVSVEDCRFLIENLPMSEQEKRLAIEEESLGKPETKPRRLH